MRRYSCHFPTTGKIVKPLSAGFLFRGGKLYAGRAWYHGPFIYISFHRLFQETGLTLLSGF